MHDVLNRKSTTSDQAKHWCMHFYEDFPASRYGATLLLLVVACQAREKVGDDTTSTEIGAADAHALGSIFHYL